MSWLSKPAGPGPLPMADSMWNRALMAVGVGLVLLLAWSYDASFFGSNVKSAVEFVTSLQFGFFCLAAGVLSSPKLSGRWSEGLVFCLAAVHSYLFYGDYLLLMHMSGDSICQVAYWNILFRPNLTGSIGVAFAKPGQVVLLGLLYQLSLIAGHIVFKVGLCLVMAACVWSLAGVASDLGGRGAGILAFIVSLWAFQTDFVFSGSALYAMTCVFSGIRFYLFYPRRRSLGRLLLALSLLFRIEAVAVLAVIWLILVLRREWRESVIFAGWSLLSLLIFTGMILRIQGSLARLDSGAAVGYVGPVLPSGQADFSIEGNPLKYLVHEIREEFVDNYYLRFLFVLVIAGVCGAMSFGRECFLAAFASLVIVLLNLFLRGGTFNLERYCDLVYGFGCSVGVGSVIRYARCALRTRTRLATAGVAVSAILLLAGFDYSRMNTYRELDSNSASEFYESAMDLLDDKLLPGGTRLLTEDDLLSHVVVVAPDQFPSVTSLQYFNICDQRERAEILSRTDYIWVDLNAFPYYYMFHLPRKEWKNDPFRLMLQDILEGRRQSGELYGFRFVTVDLAFSRLLLKVER